MCNAPTRRVNVTSCRDALNGYQQGRCFYCFREIEVNGGAIDVDVDHFFPHTFTFATGRSGVNLNGVWNLVLALPSLQPGADGKFALVPDTLLLERLHRRNGFLIESHHPLRETLIAQTGATEPERISFLQQMDTWAIGYLIHRWTPNDEAEAAF